MAQPKRFDVNKVEIFLMNSADKAQTLSYWNAAVEHGKTIRGIDERLASNNDNKQIAELLLRRIDAIIRRQRLIKAIQNAIKVKYQPQIPEMFSTVIKAMQSRFVELQRKNSNTGRVIMLMSALQLAADKSSKNGTSPQKAPQPDNEHKEHDSHNAYDSQEPQNGARSLTIEEMSIHSQGEKNISNKTSVILRTSSARRVMHLELKALKEHEELQRRLEKLEREAKEKEIADLREEVARKARIAEKEIEMAKVSSSCGSSFRSISPVKTPDDNLTKVSEWMDKTKEAENVASSINVPSVYKRTSVSAPVITVQSMHGGQCYAPR